ncbi:cardiolipin synthase [Gemella bergeri]
MNYTNFNILNINLSYVIDLITTFFNNINFDLLLTLFLIINTILAFSIVFLEYQTASSSWAWILVLFLIPYLGFILYLIFGRPIYREKIFPFSDEEKISYQERLLNRTTPYEITKDEQLIHKYRNLIELNYETDKAFLSKNNKIKIITDGKEKFDLLFEDIKNAKNYIHVQYYILKKDGIGKQLFKLLEQKLREGVAVYILYDDIGSRKLSISSLRNLTKNNAKIKSFFKSKLPIINFRMNYRNHRKIVVIDGEIGYTGGFNVGDEYLGLDKKFGYWRDTHLRIEGEAVGSLEYRFIDDWNSQSSKKAEQLSLRPDFIATHVNNYTPIQIVSSGPDSKLEKIKYGYLQMISRAKKYIYIQSPYFIPDESVMNALKMAILSGIDVRIMIPNKPDHIFVYWATYSYIGELASFGAKTYIYDNGFIHTKMIIIDNEVTSIGSANFDYRSFKLNFEMNAFIYDYQTTNTFRKIFLQDIDKSILVSYSKYQERSIIIKIKEAFARLISPIL